MGKEKNLKIYLKKFSLRIEIRKVKKLVYIKIVMLRSQIIKNINKKKNKAQKISCFFYLLKKLKKN